MANSRNVDSSLFVENRVNDSIITIYLGSENFIAQHQPDRVIHKIPRRQTQAKRPSLLVMFQRKQSESTRILLTYRRYAYRLAAIAEHLGVHYATVSRRLKCAEEADV